MSVPKEKQSLEPKAPEILQNLKWFQLYGWKYKGLVIFGALLVTGWFSLKQFSADFSAKRNTPQKVGPKGRAHLTTQEEPYKILAILDKYSGPVRDKQAKALFVDHWLEKPWSGTVRNAPTKEERGWSFTFETSIPNSQGVCTNSVRTEQDASYLRDGMKINITTGRIAADLTQGLRIDRATFQVMSSNIFNMAQ